MRRGHPRYRDSGVEWLGEVPEHWGVKRLKFVVSVNDDALSEGEDPLRSLAYVDIGSIDKTKGVVGWEEMVFEDAPSRARRLVRNGDTLVSTVRTYLRAIAPVIDPPAEMVVSTGFAVVRPRALDPGFAGWALREHGFVEEVVARSTGVSYPAINASEIGDLSVPLPPREEQCDIAAFLDHETSRIDALIEKKRLLLERLEEQRTALISRTVTRGLPPEAARAAGLDPAPRLKASGVEWLGDVPEHWRVTQLKHAVPAVTVGIVVTPAKYYEDEGIPCLRSLNVLPDGLSVEDLVYISEESNELHRKSMIFEGDIVVVRTGRPGTAAVIDHRFDGANAIDLIIVRQSRELRSDYLVYAFHSRAIAEQVSVGSGGSIQQHFNVEAVRELALALPPANEQEAIVDYLNLMTTGMDCLGNSTVMAIDRLIEYRAALITAAVTGKIDVRGSEAKPVALR